MDRTRLEADGSGRKMKKKSNKVGGGLGGMVAAMMPGAEIDKKGRVLVNIATSRETLIFNIGGVNFETYRSTLNRLPNSPLADDKFLSKNFRPEKGDYFFDRDPDVFRATLNYLRTGELHLPSYICGPAAKMELEFWGVLPNKIERCCWNNYNDWNSTLQALNQLEHDRKGALITTKINTRARSTWWQQTQPKVWNFLNLPSYSTLAKVYGFVSLFFVILSMFSFFAETTKAFQMYEMRMKPGAGTGVVIQNGSNITNGTNYTLFGIDTNESEHTKVKVRHAALTIIDLVCLVFFTLEYILCVGFAPKKLKFITSAIGVIDVLAILPDYIEMTVYAADPELVYDHTAVHLLAFLKIFRVFRIFRLIRHVPGLWILVYTLKASIGELVLLVCFMVLGILVFSSLIYFVEDRDNFESIPHGFWWALITMTTVGYGDMYPHTTLGKIVGSLCALSGLLMIGFSVPALVNNFVLYYKHVQFAIEAEREAEEQHSVDLKPVTKDFIKKEESKTKNGETVPFIQRGENEQYETKEEV